ncbi:NUDIX hydrolase [Aureimonas sp. AU20]|uniref:NUDIX hydrolase n=1 Tax=Aureimonas sp. AU20 TaxID=1349819 RepID=UPI000720BDB9|nr:NUDIX domain-containing protein [Aureimonas sp. AU20]ALN74444.1 hypothetical protein M673_17075 [Aureimonas sp. AU20]
MSAPSQFLVHLGTIVGRYRAEVASKRETLALLRWQMAEGHALDDRATLPGHVTTSAIVVSPDHRRVLLIDHIALGRWLQPGGHYEAAPFFHDSAAREAVEETGVAGLRLHPWHRGTDLPFVIDSHDVSGNPRRGEPDHVHDDLQYLFLADPDAPLRAQTEEVHAAFWEEIAHLGDAAPKAAARLRSIT